MAERLHMRLMRIFPELSDLRFDHVWTGKCGGTFDLYPHIGSHEGIHFAVGYCFAGVPMGTLFGQKLARRILGRKGRGERLRPPHAVEPAVLGKPVVRALRHQLDEPRRPIMSGDQPVLGPNI